MEEGKNFIKELEKENKVKMAPKLYKESSFKGGHGAIARIQQQEAHDDNESSDANEEEDKDAMEGADKVSDMPMPQSSFVKPPTKFTGKIKYTSNNEGQVKNKLSHSHDPRSWTDAFDEREMIDETIPIYFSGTTGPVLFCIHGAGHSALSFGPLAVATKEFARVASFDIRGHGGHKTSDEDNMSIDVLLKECMKALQYVVNKYDDASIIICGHSLGGALSAKLGYQVLHPEEGKETDFDSKQIVGVFVIDVAEGSALSALPFMEQIVESRPTSFKNMHEVIKFGVTSGQVKKLSSARLTMPDLVTEKDGEYVWKTDLLASKDYWRDWFTGMNK
jgi:protein phosphatase methylesterase 1